MQQNKNQHKEEGILPQLPWCLFSTALASWNEMKEEEDANSPTGNLITHVK